jgi:hypothetical protein
VEALIELKFGGHWDDVVLVEIIEPISMPIETVVALWFSFG